MSDNSEEFYDNILEASNEFIQNNDEFDQWEKDVAEFKIKKQLEFINKFFKPMAEKILEKESSVKSVSLYVSGGYSDDGRNFKGIHAHCENDDADCLCDFGYHYNTKIFNNFKNGDKIVSIFQDKTYKLFKSLKDQQL